MKRPSDNIFGEPVFFKVSNSLMVEVWLAWASTELPPSKSARQKKVLMDEYMTIGRRRVARG